MMQRWLVGMLMVPAIGLEAFATEVTGNSSLTVTIDGLKSQRGQVCLSLFSSDKGFPGSGDHAQQNQCVKVVGGAVAATFRNLQPGSYAVAVIHDANSDGTLNRAFLGIPNEGFGFSRNPKIQFGPPRFGDSAISVTGPTTATRIRLRYLLGS